MLITSETDIVSLFSLLNGDRTGSSLTVTWYSLLCAYVLEVASLRDECNRHVVFHHPRIISDALLLINGSTQINRSLPESFVFSN